MPHTHRMYVSKDKQCSARRLYLLYIIIIFFQGTRIFLVSSFFRLGLGMGFSTVIFDSQWKFSVKSFRSSVVFGGRLQRPSPCLIRSASRRERGYGLSETSEKLLK